MSCSKLWQMENYKSLPPLQRDIWQLNKWGHSLSLEVTKITSVTEVILEIISCPLE